MISSLPPLLFAALAQWCNSKIRTYLSRTEQLVDPTIKQWSQSQLRATQLLVLTGWARGLTVQAAAARIDLRYQQQIKTKHSAQHWISLLKSKNTMAQRLELVRLAVLMAPTTPTLQWSASNAARIR